jgi:hypothetical protein
MTSMYGEVIDDREYVARVRRHKPSSLVPLVASVAAQYWQHNSWLGVRRKPLGTDSSPWIPQ